MAKQPKHDIAAAHGRLLVPSPRQETEDAPYVPPPSTFIVMHDHKPVLFLPNGKVLVRRAGF